MIVLNIHSIHFQLSPHLYSVSIVCTPEYIIYSNYPKASLVSSSPLPFHHPTLGRCRPKLMKSSGRHRPAPSNWFVRSRQHNEDTSQDSFGTIYLILKSHHMHADDENHRLECNAFSTFWFICHLFHMCLFEDQVLEIYIMSPKKVDGIPIMLIKFYPLVFVLRNC